ncbi:hypothetical protein G7Y89_g5411 [Cudoniella acicularis]|uniref:Uncharacterized protein n=1 Tax=Cudoniella acicularis TaxID=354080 RepID=A0A8H4RNX2_9HELO|nr:hypothetical protein G7Y89_g5411 [Cudoniella acicularis]
MSNFLRSPFLLLLILLCPHNAFASPSLSPASWVKPPVNGTLTMKEEIQCYSLPYGGIGFASHVLSYYAVAMLSNSRSPLTFQKNKHPTVDKILAGVGLLVTTIVSVLTIIRCHSRWQFIAMAVWKLDLSITLGCLTFHAAALVGENEHASLLAPSTTYASLSSTENLNEAKAEGEKTKKPSRVLWWTILYIPGVIAGLTGLLSLVAQEITTNHQVLDITIAFGTIIATLAVIMLFVVVFLFGSETKKEVFLVIGTTGFMVFTTTFSAMAVLGAFYSDWILGAIAENLAGVPSSDNAPLYWSYFLAKRLPGFSF